MLKVIFLVVLLIVVIAAWRGYHARRS